MAQITLCEFETKIDIITSRLLITLLFYEKLIN